MTILRIAAFIFAALFSGSVADNIRLGRPGAPMRDVEAAARAIGADDFIANLPQGYDTDVHQKGARLSAGQRQLVSFARAFLADPAVLILDEATSSLDIPGERAVQRAMLTVLRGRTAVVIAHRLSTVEIADRVLVMEHGKIVEDGSPAELALTELLERLPVAPLAQRDQAPAVLRHEDPCLQEPGEQTDLLGRDADEVVGLARLRLGRGRVDHQGQERFGDVHRADLRRGYFRAIPVRRTASAA